MKFLDSFIKYLFPDSQLSEAKENDKELQAQFVARSYNSINVTEIESRFTFLSSRDSCHCSVTFGSSDPVILKSTELDLKTFKEKLDRDVIHLEGETITINVTINKTVIDSECTIYDLNTFVKTIKNLNANQFFTIFSRLLSSTNGVRFKVYNLTSRFFSSTISFSDLKDEYWNLESSRREEIFEGFKSQCHFTNIDNFKLLPSDFKLIRIDTSQSDLNGIFRRYTNLLSIIYLFDITTVNDNQIEYKINGYKAIKGIADIGKFESSDFDEYYEIFDWVYNGGNLNDKIGLARNILSLHFIENGELKLQGNAFQSVKSSYKVYERQNIKQYIEIRNKISDQLLEFNNRANKIVETFAIGFQKSTLALISFYISAIVIRVLSKGEFVNIFSPDATVLSLAFLSGSLIYYFVSRWEIKEQRNRFVNSYTNLKERYTDLLEGSDIVRILNNDKEFNEDVEFIDNKRKVYSRMWLLVLTILVLATIFLFVNYNFAQISNTFLFKLLFGKSCDCGL